MEFNFTNGKELKRTKKKPIIQKEGEEDLDWDPTD
jgi:hypothetical protein